MTTLSFEIPPELEKRLEYLAKKTGKQATYLLKEALAQHIEEMEDYYLAQETLEKVRAGTMEVRAFGEWEREDDLRREMED